MRAYAAKGEQEKVMSPMNNGLRICSQKIDPVIIEDPKLKSGALAR